MKASPIFMVLMLSVSISSALKSQSLNDSMDVSPDDCIQRTSLREDLSESKRYHQTSLLKECSGDNDCSPWMKCAKMNKTYSECQCREHDFYDGIVKCDTDTGILSVLDCHCVTYVNGTTESTIIAGSCIENCMSINHKLYDSIYSLLNYKLDELNLNMCGKNSHRGGQLCGKCLSGYSPLAYSFNLTCVKCTEENRNLWKFFLIVFTPITVFYFIVLFFKINATSSYLHGFVLFSQAIALSEFGRLIIITIEKGKEFEISVPVKILVSLYGFWNLDFFQIVLPGICLDMSPLSVRTLDYISAVYPFFLTTLSYILIELHDRNFRLLVFIWKPFRCLFTLFRRHWDIRTSVIDAYATIYLLSFFKILSITFDLLIPTPAYDLKNPNNTKYVLYYDGTIDYFGSEHLPYAIPAIVVALLFVVLPTLLLLLYPCRCFQCILNHIHVRWHILHTFMDSFQGCYKDGTEPGTRDYRYFAGLYLLSRILIFCVFSFTLDSIFFPFSILCILLIIILIINVQPHKEAVSHYNKINATFLCLLATFYAATVSSNIASIKAHYYVNGCYILMVLVGITPLVYITCITIHWIISRRKWGKELVNRIRAWWRGYESLDDSLPDRISNPEDYQHMDDPVNLVSDLEYESETGTGISYYE